MAIGQGIEAGKAFVKFILDDKEFKSKLESTGKSLTKWGAIGTAATAPIIAGLTASAMAFANAGSEIADMSARTGLGAEALSELKYAAEQSGSSMEAVERSVKKMQVGIANAAAGNGTLARTFDLLGVNLDTLKNQSPEQQFTTLASAIASVKDPTERAAMATKVFGKSGTELLPMLAEGATGLQTMRDKARALGITLSDEDAAAADTLGDAIDTMKAQVFSMSVQIGAAIAGPLTQFLEWSQGVLGSVIQFIKENPRMIAAFSAIAVAVAGCSAALMVFGTLLTIITLHPIIAALTAIAAALVGIAAYFGLASSGAGQFKKSLDQLKAGTKVDPAAQARTMKVQQAIEASMKNASQSPMTSSMADAGEKQSNDHIANIDRWTRASYDTLRQILSRMDDGGFEVGAT